MKEKLTLKELQKIELDILLEFHKFCEQNKLHYYLGGGTLLGAIRHSGFIPWDDDIDIMMPRNDYLKFIDLMKLNKINENYDIDCMAINENALSAVLRIYDKRTELVFKNYRKQKVFGCWIDIFPLDGLSESEIKRKFHFYISRFLQDLLIIHDTKIEGKRRNAILSMIQYLIVPFLPVVYLIGRNRILNWMNSIYQIFDYQKSKYIGCLEGRAMVKETMLKDSLEPAILLDFEGYRFYGPANYHQYLTNLYGDYMSLPPVEKRVSRHLIDVYWK